MNLNTDLLNKELVNYGVFQENSDIRAHVSNKIVFVFKTEEVVKALKRNWNKYITLYATQPNCGSNITGVGKGVPPGDVKGLIRLKYHSWAWWESYDNRWDTSKKGNWAVACVKDLMKMGRFPFFVDVEGKDIKNISIDEDKQGTDVLVCLNKRIQVKCDYPVFRSKRLFIQTHECNPHKKY